MQAICAPRKVKRRRRYFHVRVSCVSKTEELIVIWGQGTKHEIKNHNAISTLPIKLKH